MPRGVQALRFSVQAISAVRGQRELKELRVEARFERVEAVPVEMAFLVEFNGNSTHPEIPPPNRVREVVELAVQLFVDRLDFAPEAGYFDVLPSQARAFGKLKRVSGLREEPG